MNKAIATLILSVLLTGCSGIVWQHEHEKDPHIDVNLYDGYCDVAYIHTYKSTVRVYCERRFW